MIIEKGHLRGIFTGFRNKETVFEFLDGNKWIQAEYRKYQHDSFMPHAVIKDVDGRYYLEVDGISDTVEVKKWNPESDLESGLGQNTSGT